MEYKNEHETFNDADSTEELFAKYSKNRDVAIRNEIVKRYLYLAEIISKKFINRGVEYDDIHQVASLALIKAVERFSPDKGFKFASFATPTIVGEIKRYFRDKSSSIRIPRRIYEEYHRVNNARDHLMQQLGRVPRPDEIAGYLGIGEEAVLEILESWNAYNIQSLDQNAFEDDDIELHETLGEEDTTFEKIENKDFIEKSLQRFNDVEKEFIRMRYFNKKTQKEIADKMGVSQMYVSRLEHKVLDRFRLILSK